MRTSLTKFLTAPMYHLLFFVGCLFDSRSNYDILCRVSHYDCDFQTYHFAITMRTGYYHDGLRPLPARRSR
jgi:hypothetical protein